MGVEPRVDTLGCVVRLNRRTGLGSVNIHLTDRQSSVSVRDEYLGLMECFRGREGLS